MQTFWFKNLALLSRRYASLIVMSCLGCATTSPTTDKAMNDTIISRFSMTNPLVQTMGRTEPLADGSVRFAYPGVTTRFNVSGKAFWLQARSTSDQSYLEIIVDNTEPQVIQLSSQSQRIPLVFETPSPHQVAIIHRGETWHGVVTLEHIEIADGGLLDPSPLPHKRMLILGDSVTCGEAIERTADCKKTTRWWNPRLSYGMLTAAALDAQVNLVCYGGRGLVRSWNGRTDELNLPDYAELTIADPASPVAWDHGNYTPDLILSAIGTNDFSQGIPDREDYVSTYVALIKRLFELYPKTHIVLTEGAILSGEKKAALTAYLTEVQQRVASPQLNLVTSNHYPGDACDAHPTKAQHAAMAKDLAPHLKRIMHW